MRFNADSSDTIYNFSINVNGDDFLTKLSSLGITTKETQPSRPFWLNHSSSDPITSS
jgi:hypothetical protein